MKSVNPTPLDRPTEILTRPDRRLGTILRGNGVLTYDEIDRILAAQKRKGTRFGETAVRLGLIGVDDLRRAIAQQYDLPHLAPGNKRISNELVVAAEPFHRCAEQIRALRTQLLVKWANGAIRGRMLAVTSPGPREGRSYIAANLAVAFSQLGERTLLIDADLRRPRQHRIFGIDDSVGLTALLSGRADTSAIFALGEFGNLSVLPAGVPAPNPLELLSRDAFVILLHELQRDFQVILLDTPPAQLCADAQSIAFRAGSALVLARKDHTRMVDTRRLISDIRDTGAGIAGTILNTI